jgi:hypothetical protein
MITPLAHQSGNHRILRLQPHQAFFVLEEQHTSVCVLETVGSRFHVVLIYFGGNDGLDGCGGLVPEFRVLRAQEEEGSGGLWGCEYLGRGWEIRGMD